MEEILITRGKKWGVEKKEKKKTTAIFLKNVHSAGRSVCVCERERAREMLSSKVEGKLTSSSDIVFRMHSVRCVLEARGRRVETKGSLSLATRVKIGLYMAWRNTSKTRSASARATHTHKHTQRERERDEQREARGID